MASGSRIRGPASPHIPAAPAFYRRLIAGRYDRQARFYDSLYGEEQKAKYRILPWRDILEGPVLDAGCGTGLFMEALKAQGLETVGVDLSIGMLEGARRRGLGRSCHLILADAAYLPFTEGAFGTACSFTVLDRPQAPRILSQLYGVVRDGGALILSLPKKCMSMLEAQRILEASGMKPIEVCDQPQAKDYVILCTKQKAPRTVQPQRKA
ncbi:MAG: class I SAM-dependent methyltransferase [Candidatus Bathyarchaeia archaeon]